MKVLLWCRSYRQRNEIKLAAHLLSKTETLRNFDLIFHCNNLESSVWEHFRTFPNENKELIHTSKNTGYDRGCLEALSDNFDKFKDYDYVIHFQTDVFILGEEKILEVLDTHKDTEDVFLCTQSRRDESFLSFDFFIFKPKLLHKNIFKLWEDEEYGIQTEEYNSSTPRRPDAWRKRPKPLSIEHLLYKMIKEHNIPYCLLKRYKNNKWFPRRIDMWNMWHEHELEKVVDYLELGDGFLSEEFHEEKLNSDAVGGFYEGKLKFVAHIPVWYVQEKVKYLQRVINYFSEYPSKVDVVIHTNSETFSNEDLNAYDNGEITIKHYDYTEVGWRTDGGDYLTWEYRDMIKEQMDDYDVFMYLEDDLGIPKETVNYWLRYKDLCLKHNYNLGFFRAEDHNGTLVSTDLPDEKRLNRIINLEGVEFAVNDVNPYCAFWIYDKEEFKKFCESKYFDPRELCSQDVSEEQPLEYGVCELSAIGMHGKGNIWYEGTIIPVVNEQIHSDSKILHLPNNFLNHEPNSDEPRFGTVPLAEVIQGDVR